MNRPMHIGVGLLIAALLVFSATGAGIFGLAAKAYAIFPGANGKIVFVSERDGNREIYVMNPDGSGQTRLTNNSTTDEYPAWSSDGKKIVFDKESSLNVMNVDGTGVIQVAAGFDSGPSWSPDGTKIAFDKLDNGIRRIMLINADGTGEKILGGAGLHNLDPRWSPDGTKIAFWAAGNGAGIYLINPDGSGLKQIGVGSYPDWSPDGSKIAVGNGGIWIMNTDGTNVTPVPNTTGADHPRWSPDGKKFVFSKDDGIYVINADGSGLVKIDNESTPFYHGFPDWGIAQPVLTIKSQDMNGNPISGYWTVLYDSNNNVLKTGFTPVTFTLNAGQQYKIGMGKFGSYSFDHWLDNNSSGNPRGISINSSTQLTAVYQTSAVFYTIHMSDTTATAGYGVHAPKPARAEYASATSQLVGDKIDSITLKLKRVGTITGTATIGILDSGNNVKKSFGTINVATLTTAYTDYESHLTGGELYTIQSGDRIGIKYTGGDASNWVSVMLDLDPADPFDGTNSYHQYYQGGWLSNTDRDMYMVLKQTHA